eukprot:11254791-Alexandrium_andersonii.AAC.1
MARRAAPKLRRATRRAWQRGARARTAARPSCSLVRGLACSSRAISGTLWPARRAGPARD